MYLIELKKVLQKNITIKCMMYTKSESFLIILDFVLLILKGVYLIAIINKTTAGIQLKNVKSHVSEYPWGTLLKIYKNSIKERIVDNIKK